MNAPEERKTIPLIPSWLAIMPLLTHVMENGKDMEGRLAARTELERMARIADTCGELFDALQAMVKEHGRRDFPDDALMPPDEQQPDVAQAMRALAKMEPFRTAKRQELHLPAPQAPARDDDPARPDTDPDDAADERNCAHEWNMSAAQADEAGPMQRIYCLKCGQDGDA